jgi:branched-chain amino acid transport system substrate-binding protein
LICWYHDQTHLILFGQKEGETVKLSNVKKVVTILALAAGLAFGFSPAVLASGTVTVGFSNALSGSIAELGISSKHGIDLAIQHINANGGLLGKQIKLVSADGEEKPNTGVTNVRNFILKDNVKAILGPATSAVGAAEAQIAARYHVPIFFIGSNDVDQTGKYFSKYVFQVVPSTYMEPHAIAAYLAKRSNKHHWKNYYTISPNYSFGHDTVKLFLAGMKEYGANIDVVGQQWPKLGASDFTQYISAIKSKNPDFVFIGQYGGDLVTFTKQAEGYGLFKKAHVYGGYWLLVLEALGAKAPSGAITTNRTRPFYLSDTKAMRQFTKTYHNKYDDWPTTWAVLAYSGVEAWAQGVKKAGSFDADKVSEAISGATIKSIRGDFKIRECDHMAEVPEYVGVLSKKVDPKYGFRTMTDVYEAPPGKIMMSCKQNRDMQEP